MGRGPWKLHIWHFSWTLPYVLLHLVLYSMLSLPMSSVLSSIEVILAKAILVAAWHSSDHSYLLPEFF